jgi:hypothetical protein
MQIVAFTLKYSVLFDVNHNIQIAWRATIHARFAFATQANAIAFVDTGRNLNRECFMRLYAARAFTITAWIRNVFARAMACRARLLHAKEALRNTNLSMTTTGVTRFSFGPWLSASTIADFTFIM